MRLGPTRARTPNRGCALTPTQSEPMPQLQCENCGLSYPQHALARHIALTTGVACPRCRGALRPHQIKADPETGDSIAATRAAHHQHKASAPPE